jgi:hypothetical protein
MCTYKFSGRYQLGQAYFETLACLTVVFAFLMGAHYLWRSAELAQMAVDAVRFAAWERTVWEPDDNNTEVYALHKTDDQLGKDVVMRQLSAPAAWRNFRTNLSPAGVPAAASSQARRDVLHTSAQKFVTSANDPNDMITLRTDSGWGNDVEGEFRGIDPTYNTTTSLKLDRNTWRTVKLTLKGNPEDMVIPYLRNGTGTNYNARPQDVTTNKKFSLITNTWAASPPVAFVRERQLMPFSTEDKLSGYKGNYLGNYSRPVWAVVGGPNGFGGQYLARQIGINANQAAELIHSSGESFDFDMSNPLGSMGLIPQTQQSEFFNQNAVSQWHHRHTFVVAEDEDSKGEPDKKAFNSNIKKKKYRAFSGQNPIDTYFTR